VHPRFRRDRALALLAKTGDHGQTPNARIVQGDEDSGSPGLTMAIDAKLLVLDEPTLGLDILARRAFTMHWSTTTWTRRAPS